MYIKTAYVDFYKSFTCFASLQLCTITVSYMFLLFLGLHQGEQQIEDMYKTELHSSALLRSEWW